MLSEEEKLDYSESEVQMGIKLENIDCLFNVISGQWWPLKMHLTCIAHILGNSDCVMSVNCNYFYY